MIRAYTATLDSDERVTMLIAGALVDLNLATVWGCPNVVVRRASGETVTVAFSRVSGIGM